MDFMPVKARENNCVLVRSVVATRGAMHLVMRCCVLGGPRPGHPHCPAPLVPLAGGPVAPGAERNLPGCLFQYSLVYRYHPGAGATDGLEGEEGTFTMCSFWYVECLSKSGQVEKARMYFEKMLGYASHLGLFAEQLGYQGQHLGNFPQAFTHLGLISAALELDRALDQRDRQNPAVAAEEQR